MQKKKKDSHFIKHAFYEGGNTAFRKFVSETLKYPKEALSKDIEGVVHLKIDINYKGKVTGVKVMKGIGHGCDAEAMRIMKLAEYEIPANPKKLRVKFQKNVRIQFKKPKEQSKAIEKPKPEVDPKAKVASKAKTKVEAKNKPAPVKGNQMTISYELSPSKSKAESKGISKNKPKGSAEEPQKAAKNSYSYTIKYNS